MKVHNEEFYRAGLWGFLIGVVFSSVVGVGWWLTNAPMIKDPTKACWQSAEKTLRH